MRARWLVPVVVLGAAVAVVPLALGVDGTVSTSGNSFSPLTVTINAGEQVTFNNGGGTHDVTFENAAIAMIPTNGWPASRQFPQAGTYGYFCSIHVSSSNMRGTVVVNPPGTPPPTGTTPPPTGPAPVPTPTPSPTPTPGPGPTVITAPTLGARVLTKRACTRKGANCKRPGIRIRVTAQEALVATGQLQRRARGGAYRSSGRVRFSAAKGTTTATVVRRIDGTRIGPGDYRLTLTGVRGGPNSDGKRSARVVLRFVVRR